MTNLAKKLCVKRSTVRKFLTTCMGEKVCSKRSSLLNDEKEAFLKKIHPFVIRNCGGRTCRIMSIIEDNLSKQYLYMLQSYADFKF